MKEMNEEEFFYTGIDDKDYQLLNGDGDVSSYPWDVFFQYMYEHWVENTERYTPFAYLQKFLFPIHSYSKRILCVRHLQDVAFKIIEKEHHEKHIG